MSKAVRLFKALIFSLVIAALLVPVCFAEGEGGVEFKDNPSSVRRDTFDQNIYYEGTNLLHLDRLYRLIFRQKQRAKDVNVFDEVPDSAFFTNRHAKSPMSEADLAKGYQENDGLDLSGDLLVDRGKFEGSKPGFFVKDKKGDEYLLEFDSADSLEAQTAAQVIGSRFYYALGYNVPQSTIASFESSKLVPAEGVRITDGTGFKKKLTKGKLEEYLLFIPWSADGKFRAAATKMPVGESKGTFTFQGRRRQDPQDVFDHEDRREIRALQVFASWLNNTDLRQENTWDAVVSENGKKYLKHYLLNFKSTLGAETQGDKPPYFGHEYFIDYGETTKAVFGLGWWEKPWQKRWREAGEKVGSPEAGYFDNRRFNPAKYKNQLPLYAFKDLSRADGFWAAKTIMSFKDSDIAAIVKTGQYSEAATAETITKVLTERRDILGRYWFSHSNPLDSFEVNDGRLVFEDLAVKYGFESMEHTAYQVEAFKAKGQGWKKAASMKVTEASLRLDPSWFGENGKAALRIRNTRAASSLSPYVWVELTSTAITRIAHED